MSGRVVSEETRAKIRAAAIGRKMSDEARAKIRAANLGRKCSPETMAKMRSHGYAKRTATRRAQLLEQGLGWTDEQLATLRELYRTIPAHEIGARLGKSTGSVQKTAKRLGLSVKQEHHDYTAEEDAKIAQMRADGAQMRDIADALGVSRNGLCKYAQKLVKSGALKRCEMPVGLRFGTGKPWSDADNAAIRAGVAAGMSDKKIGAQIGRTKNAVSGQRNRLGIVRAPKVAGSGRDADILKWRANGLSGSRIGNLVGLTRKQVDTRIVAMRKAGVTIPPVIRLYPPRWAALRVDAAALKVEPAAAPVRQQPRTYRSGISLRGVSINYTALLVAARGQPNKSLAEHNEAQRGKAQVRVERIRKMLADGMTKSDIRKSLKIGADVLDLLMRENGLTDSSAKRVTRTCMCCGRQFGSSGVGNRLCYPCKERGSEASPWE